MEVEMNLVISLYLVNHVIEQKESGQLNIFWIG